MNSTAIPEDFPTNEQKIMALAKHDPTVLAIMKMAALNDVDYVEMLEILVLQLQAEKKQLWDNYVKLMSTATQPAPVIMPEGFKLA